MSKLLLVLGTFLTFSCKINVHLVPHTHTDLGWLNTIDGYFYKDYSRAGSHDKVAKMEGAVNTIITNVVDSLLDDPSRKFTWSEMKYFQMWWKLQKEAKKNQVRYLANTAKQLEFVNGGWVANDEACPTYEDILANFIVGQ